MSDGPEQFDVRRARPEDAAAIATVQEVALGDKFRAAYGRATARVLAALARHDLRHPGERHFVATMDGAVVGAVHLALDQQPDPGFPDRVATEAGWLCATRAVVVLSALAHGRLESDEAYVQSLGVLPRARRQGVATALLAECEEEARRAGRRRVTLWVTGDNLAATALYEGRGYRVRRRRRSIRARLLLKVTSTLLMEKALV